MDYLRYLLRVVGFAIGILIGVLAGSVLTIGADASEAITAQLN